MGRDPVCVSTALVVGACISWLHLFCAARAYSAHGSTLVLDLIARRRARGTLAGTEAAVRVPVELWERIKRFAQALNREAFDEQERHYVALAMCADCHVKCGETLPKWYEHDGFLTHDGCPSCCHSARKVMRYATRSRNEVIEFLWQYGLAAEGVYYRDIPEPEWTQPDDPDDETYADSQEARMNRKKKAHVVEAGEDDVAECDNDSFDEPSSDEYASDADEYYRADGERLSGHEYAVCFWTKRHLKWAQALVSVSPLADQVTARGLNSTSMYGYGEIDFINLTYEGPVNLDKLGELVRKNTPLYRLFLEDWPVSILLDGGVREPCGSERAPQVFQRVLED